MKFFAVVLLSVLATGLAFPADNELTASEEQFVEDFVKNYAKEIERYMKSMMASLSEAICEDKQTSLEEPLQEVIKRSEEVDDQSDTVCGLIKNNLAHVLEPMTKAIDGCLPNEEAGVADFIVKAIVSLMSHICGSTGEQLMELVNPCLEDINMENSKCIENVEEKWNEISTTKSSMKTIVCQEYSDARTCFETAVNDKCKLQVTRDSIMGLLDSVLKTPCA